MERYPLKFEDLYQERIWGGRNLERWLDKRLPPGDARIGESWEVADHRTETSVVANGPYRRRILRSLREEFGDELVGRRGLDLGRNQVPLLIKFLDAQQVLSVQVHPDDRYAAEHEKGELGKSEMWYVIHAEPGATLISGLKPGTTRETLERAIADCRVESCLNQFEVHAGECYFTPAGRVHAIGAGNLICEVQQNSDVTYRFYDWNRVGDDGKPRELHIEKSLDVIDYGATGTGRVEPKRIETPGAAVLELVRCRYFVAEKLEVSGSLPADTRGETFQILSLFQGKGRIEGDAFEPVPVRKGESVFVPCALGRYNLVAEEPIEALRSSVPVD